MGSYPNSIVSFVVPKNNDPLFFPNHVDYEKKQSEEIVSIEREIGLNPSGSAVNLTSRLNESINLDGSLRISPGSVTKPTFTDNGNGSATLSSGTCYLFSNTYGSGSIKLYEISGIVANFTDLVTNYIVADYNSGSPIYRVTTVLSEIDFFCIYPIYTVFRDGNILYYLDWDRDAYALATKLVKRLIKTERFIRETGLVLGESSGRIITVTEGKVWYGANSTTVPAASSDVSKTEFWYHSSGSWTKDIVTQWPNNYYDDGTNRQSLLGNKYGACFIYVSVSSSDDIFILVDGSHNKLEDAQKTQPPLDKPPVIATQCILVGRIIFLNGAAVATQIDSAFNLAFSFSGTTTKNYLITNVTTTPYTVISTDELIVVSSTSDVTINLPASSGSGRIIVVKNINTGDVIDGNSSDTIDGELTQTLYSYESVQLVDSAANQWMVI